MDVLCNVAQYCKPRLRKTRSQRKECSRAEVLRLVNQDVIKSLRALVWGQAAGDVCKRAQVIQVVNLTFEVARSRRGQVKRRAAPSGILA